MPKLMGASLEAIGRQCTCAELAQCWTQVLTASGSSPGTVHLTTADVDPAAVARGMSAYERDLQKAVKAAVDAQIYPELRTSGLVAGGIFVRR